MRDKFSETDCYEATSGKQKVRKFKDREGFGYSDYANKKPNKFKLTQQRKLKESSQEYFSDNSED